jgi:hypothetical protein
MTDKPNGRRDEPPEKERSPGAQTICPVCRGTGLDRSLHPRYTTGGHDDRRCQRCNGECYIDLEGGGSA